MDVSLPVSTELDIEELIKHYFKAKRKFKHIDICRVVNQHHRKKLKLRQLLLLRKRNVFEDLLAIISNELGTSLAKILVIDRLINSFPLNIVST